MAGRAEQPRQNGGRCPSPGVPPPAREPPRNYSEFMRNLAAKYNNENPAESAPRAVIDPRLAQPGKPPIFPPGTPFGFPPFFFPPTSSTAAPKDSSGSPVSSPLSFLPGFRPPGAPGLPPSMFPPGLLDPSHAQALLSMVRGTLPHPDSTPRHPSPDHPSPHPPLDLTSCGPPAKKLRRCSSSTDDPQGVSPPPCTSPPSEGPRSSDARSCVSACISTPCSEEGREVAQWSVDQVVQFVSSVNFCHEYSQVFRHENIDGSVLVLLTDNHLLGLGLKLGPVLRIRSALSAKLGTCPTCTHCRHCHAPSKPERGGEGQE